MINQYEVPAYLVDELPEIAKDLKAFSPTLNIFKSIQCLANYTRSKLLQHDLKAMKKCFAVADEVYVNGNALVKTAIENVFVHSLSSLMNLCANEERKQVQAVMPLHLHTAYVQQILKSEI
jgi:hypothetical protein